MIDIDKFICSLLADHPEGVTVRRDIHKALKDQGLEYKDGKIVKVEPKYHKGEWVVYSNEDVGLITGIDEDGYTVNEAGFIPFSCEKNMQPWDITLAKDGDVLADKGAIVLFKSIGNEDCNNVIDYYVYTSGVTGEFIVQEGGHYWGDTQDCTLTPATQEQRKGFFAAMHDAGYEWDAEHKRLKKVEPKEELSEFENRLCEIVDSAMQNPVDNPNTIIFDVKKKLVPELLKLAQKQLQQEFDKQIEQVYKNADEVQYRRGYKQAIEDAVRYMDKVWGLNILGNSINDFRETMEQKLKELSQS